MIIRKAKKEDSKLLDNMLTMLIQEEREYDKSISEDFVVKNMYEKYVYDNKKCLIVAEEDEKIVGYLYGFLCEEPTIKDKTSFIDAIYVLSDYRNNGIATSLIDAFKKWSINNKVNIIKINVMSDNTIAKSLYYKKGFTTQRETLMCEID